MKTYFFLILALFIGLNSCQKGPSCPYSQTILVNQANFTISETCNCGAGCLWEDYISDTNSGTEIIFNASLKNAIYEWHIGAGVYTQDSFSLNFGAAPNGSVIPIMLIVKPTPNTKCFFGNRTSDTLIQSMVINRTGQSYLGNWSGYYYDTTGKQISSAISQITIKELYKNIGNNDSLPGIYGITPYCDTAVYNPIPFYRELVFQYYDYPDTIGVAGRAVVDSTDNNINIFIEWNAADPPYTLYKKIFKGTRQ